MDIICLVPFRHNVMYEIWISGYSAFVDTHDEVPVLSTLAGLTVFLEVLFVDLTQPGLTLEKSACSSLT